MLLDPFFYLFFFFFFLMIRRPPRSTLFPYRRSSDLDGPFGVYAHALRDFRVVDVRIGNRARRSEEHTSELQSQSNLVCRLLLEKKKKKKTNSVNIYLKNTSSRIDIISSIT